MSGNSSTPVDQEMSASNNSGQQPPQPPSRYESQKRRDWNTFGQYLRNHRPPLALARCSGAHVLEFLRYLDQFGKTKVHATPCPFFGHPHPPAPCPCPLRQAWGSLDALIGRLRAAFDENVAGSPDANPFAARAVRLYLREVRDSQSKARGIAYDKKKKRRRRPPPPPPPPPPSTAPQGLGGGGGDPMSAPPPHYAVGNLPVRDLNSPTGALLLHHHHLSHHGHVLIALDGSHGGVGVGLDGVDLGVGVGGSGDPPNGSLIPLSVFNQC